MFYALYLDDLLVQTGIALDVATDLLAMLRDEYPSLRITTRRLPVSY